MSNCRGFRSCHDKTSLNKLCHVDTLASKIPSLFQHKIPCEKIGSVWDLQMPLSLSFFYTEIGGGRTHWNVQLKNSPEVKENDADKCTVS